jgi:hypothetical protein
MVDLREFSVDVATSSGTGCGKLTQVTSGVNLPPLEVIMSRRMHTCNAWEFEISMALSGERRFLCGLA